MKIFDSILDPLRALYPELASADLPLTAPPSLEHGDIAVPFFLAAKRLKQAPPKLAADAAARAKFSDLVREAAAAGPYLNLCLHRSRAARVILEHILATADRFGAGNTGQGLHAVIEHTSINPNASPHLGRARCAMIGDSISRLFRFEGYDVEVHYYVNDMGRQIGLLVLMADEVESLSFDEILDAYVRANARAEEDPAFAE
ncbi:MAG: arginine--tRNA ligase, partial [Candidatus Hydrogenedentes bacterium]|nr:arginine--tRNA ligase [Candidatus Hydrogenedentota bacterium]